MSKRHAFASRSAPSRSGLTRLRATLVAPWSRRRGTMPLARISAGGLSKVPQMPYSQIENARLRAAMQDRALEWHSALVMFGWGVVLAMPGDTMAGPSFAAFDRYGATEEFWAWMFGVMGAARLVALYINGRWPKSPWVRMVGALFGAISWAQVTWLIFQATTLQTGVWSTGLPVYLALALADLFSIFRAAFDARYYTR